MRRFPVCILAAVILLFLAGPVCAVSLEYAPGTAYGTLEQKPGIEISPALSETDARNIVSLFASTNMYLKITQPATAFPSSAAFSVLDRAAGGWYLSLPEGAESMNVITAFTKATSKQVVVEVVPFSASFIREVKSRFPFVKIHTAGYFYWPREDVKTALSQVAPPTLEAISMEVESGTNTDMFADVKLMFDTFFDASADVPGTSIKIGYPQGTILSLSDIRPKHQDASARSAYLLAVAAANSVSSIQHQGKNNKAPYRYIILGSYSGQSPNAASLIARYARFMSLKPAVIWPLAVSGNGGPFDGSKPVVGIIGVLNGETEGMLVNTSGSPVPVALPYPVTGNAYSSLTGSFIPTANLQLSPYEAVFFGNNISKSAPLPPPATPVPVRSPIPPPRVPTASTQPPSSIPPLPRDPIPQAPSPAPVDFSISTPTPLSLPVPPNDVPSLSRIPWKQYARIFIVKTDPLLQTLRSLFHAVRRTDGQLEQRINSILPLTLPVSD